MCMGPLDMKQMHVHNSATGTRTRVARVRAEYPNQLDYSGADMSNCPCGIRPVRRPSMPKWR